MGLGTITAEVDSAFAWWRLAGVEDWAGETPCLWFDETAYPGASRRPFLKEGDRAVRQSKIPFLQEGAAERSVAGVGRPPAIPDTLPALTDWLRTSDSFAAVGPRRLAPGGPAGGTMIVVDMPELADLEAGRLFAGALEAQVDALLKAVGLTRESVYLATMLPGRTPDGRIPPALLTVATEALHRHVALVAPARLWAMGDAAAQALFGTRVNPKRRDLLDFEGIVGIATIHPRLLLDDPGRERRKAMWPVMQLLFPKDDA